MNQIRLALAFNVLLFTVSFTCGKDPSQETPLPPVSAKALVTVGTKSGTGSGTIFSVQGDKSYILTAEHVVHPYGQKGLTVWVIHGRKRVAAEILATDAVTDIAVVRVEGLANPEAVKFAEKEFVEGDTVFHYGRATGPQEGKVVAFENFTERGRTARCDIISTPGDSGALKCNTKGELVNMHTGRMWDDDKLIDTTPGHGIGANLERIKKFTAPYRKKD